MRRIPLGSDLKVYYYPGWAFFHNTLHSFSSPFWCDYIYSGFPLFADSEAGIFYPVNYLSYLLPLNVGYNLMFWLHYLLAAIFFYVYVREIGSFPLDRRADGPALFPFRLCPWPTWFTPTWS